MCDKPNFEALSKCLGMKLPNTTPNKRKYPDMFYNYAFSGQANCNKCKSPIKRGQWVYVFGGNIYHDICSENLKDREKLEEE